MRVDSGSFNKNTSPNKCSPSHQRLPGPKVVALHQQQHIQPQYLRFSKVLQIREVLHRNDMSPSELNEQWEIDPEISPSIFDVHPEAMPSSEESTEKKRKRRRAYMIRRKVLSEFSNCRRKGNDSFSAARNYTKYSAQAVQEAHVAALKHAHDVEEEEDLHAVVPVTDAAPLQRKRLSETHPLAAVKRLRLY